MDEKVLILIYGGATQNFINESFMTKKKLKDELYSGFIITIEKPNITPYNKLIKKLKVTIGDYKVTQEFYVFPMGNLPHVVLGAQW